MSDGRLVHAALERLDVALGRLEDAVEKRQAKTLSMKALQGDLQRMSKERSDLTSDLHKEQTRALRLETANEEVSRRLGAAMESVRAVLDQHGG